MDTSDKVSGVTLLRSGKTRAVEIRCYSQNEITTQMRSNTTNQTCLLITCSNEGMRKQGQESGKDRKERNLASSPDRVTRDSHHHGSSSVHWSVVPVCVFKQTKPHTLLSCFRVRGSPPTFPNVSPYILGETVSKFPTPPHHHPRLGKTLH